METLEEALAPYQAKYKSSVKYMATGAALGLAGFVFDYSFVDDVVMFVGVALVSWNATGWRDYHIAKARFIENQKERKNM